MPLLYEWLQRSVRDRGSGGGTALVYRDTYLSWRGLAHRVDRRAQEIASYGVGAGAWVGVMLGNVPDFVVLALAVSKLGATLVPIDPTTGPRDLDMILEAAPLRALVTRPGGGDTTPPGGVPVVTAARVGGPRPHQTRFVPESRRRLQGTLLNFNLFRPEARPPAGIDPALVLFTTDAGGDPKGVLRTRSELDAIAASIASTLELDGQEQTLALAPLHHTYGFDFGLVSSLARGSTLFLDDELDARRLAKGLRDQNIDLFPGTPTLYAALARVATARPLEVARPRFLNSGAPLPHGVAQAFAARFNVPILSCYHTTETGPVSLDRTGAAPATVGKVFDGVALRVGDAEGRTLESGAAGGLWIRSASVARLFVPDIALPKGRVAIGRANGEGWYRTGDRGRINAAGLLVLEGREDDIVKIEGKRVALGEVEGCLESSGKVRAAEARVVPDEAGGASVIARVVRAIDCRAEELIDHCARHLAPHKVPRQIEFCEQLG